MFSNAIRIFDVFGFQIKVDPSWLVIAALIVWNLSTGYFPQTAPGLGQMDYIALSVVAMLGLFACLILHELAHSLVARRFGLHVGGITLFLFGGVAELEAEPASAGSEFWIAVAGPVMSFGLAGLTFLAAQAAAASGVSMPLHAGLSYLALINTVLAVFNLLPAFPLDGGRVLRAFLWYRFNDVIKATRVATGIASGFAYLLIGFGLLSLFSGGQIGGLWQILIGFFLLAASRNTYQQLLVRSALKGKTVTALMTTAPRTVEPDATVSDLVDTIMLPHAISFVPVTEGDHLLGYIDTAMLKSIERDNWPNTRVEDVLEQLGPANSVRPDVPTDALLRRIAEHGRRKYLVTENGKLLGVITLSDLLGYIAVQQEIGLPRTAPLHQERTRH
jgi:Zn-dependent protease/CBS domain-containing protein